MQATVEVTREGDPRSLTSAEKIGAALQRSLPHLAPALRDELAKILTPEAIGNRYVTLLRVSGNTRPFLPELGGLMAGGFLLHGMAFEIWETLNPPRESPPPP